MATPSLRIIGGDWGGRRLQAPPGLDTRPLTDRIKQSLFDWLGQTMEGWRVADACAGSGAFGIECASRGASEVHMCEPMPYAASTISANLRLVGDPPGLHLHAKSFDRVLPKLNGLDLVFCDPPFPWFRDERERLSELLKLAAAAIGPEGLVVIRGERGETLPDTALVERERREYGRSWIAILSQDRELQPLHSDAG